MTTRKKALPFPLSLRILGSSLSGALLMNGKAQLAELNATMVNQSFQHLGAKQLKRVKIMFKSEIKEKFGISCTEALKLGIIQKGTTWSHLKNDVINDGWECVNTSTNYATQSEALEAHFSECARIEAEALAMANKCEALPPVVGACLNGEESGVRKALRKIRSMVFDDDFNELYSKEEIDQFFAKLKQLLKASQA
jgi:hypothetical protein